jgi:hypothetical protein
MARLSGPHRWPLEAIAKRPSTELTSTCTIRSRFVYVTRSTVPDYMIRAGHPYRLVTDHQHSPRLIIDTQTG